MDVLEIHQSYPDGSMDQRNVMREANEEDVPVAASCQAEENVKKNTDVCHFAKHWVLFQSFLRKKLKISQEAVE